MAADITSSQLELIVIGVAVALFVALAGIRAVRRRRYRARRAAGGGIHSHDGTRPSSGRSAGGRQPVAPSFSSAPERATRRS